MSNSMRNGSVWRGLWVGLVTAMLLAWSSLAGASTLPAATGTLNGSTRTFNLWAKEGTATLPAGATLRVWGYTDTAGAALTTAGGPLLIVNQNETVVVNLTNTLGEASGILFQGQTMVPDMAGAAASTGTKTYTFSAGSPGTFLYEAALLRNAQHQTAMGLYGALIVRPAPASVSTSGTATSADTLGLTLTDSAANFSALGYVVGAKLQNTTDGSSCTIASRSATTLTCAERLAGGTNNAWAAADAYTASAGLAYGPSETAYQDETALVLSEIDPALNGMTAIPSGCTSTTPQGCFDMRDFAPKYFLINGKAYPDSDAIASAAGSRLLLRYINAGVRHHSMAVLGLRQNFVAKDAGLLPTLTHNVAAETLAAGQTGDAIATIPASSTSSGKFALYEGNLMLHNNGASGFGGMLTFVTAGAGSAAKGPKTSAVALAPNKSNGSADVALSASIASTTSTVSAAEYFIDSTGANGAGIAMSGTFSTATVAVNATITTAAMATLAAGNHTFYVHGKDAANNWGPFSSAVLNLDKAGPASTGLTLTPNPSNGTVQVSLHATGSDAATGGSNIAAAEFFVGAAGASGSGTPMTVSNTASPTASLDAKINPPVTAGLVSVHSQDSLGNWGPFATITLNVVAAGPVTSAVKAAPNPNNGALPLSSTQPVVRITATLTSTGSTVAAAEGFIDSNPAVTVRGFGFIASDGAWNSATETAYVDVPLATINALANGNHTIYVRGKDAAGNWGATATTVLVIDKTAPTIASVTPSPAAVAFGAASVTLNVNASDTGGAGLAGGQYWIDGSTTPPANPTAFTGTSVSVGTSALAAGSHTVHLRVKDGAGNWSGVTNVTLYVVRAIADARAVTAAGGGAQTNDVASGAGVLSNDQPTGVAGRTAALASAPARTAGTGAGTLSVSCPASLGTAATPAIGGNTVCTNGAYRITLIGTNAAAKRGTFSFTYTETLNGAASTAAVTITVN